MDLKTEALLTVARAYINRGITLQYDQRCMDRKLFLTPRRTKRVPPESATSQKTLYLDCSSYIGAIFYEAFGYELPYDLTWHMVDYLEPRLYYYERTHKETPEEIKEQKEKMLSILKAGDVITFDRISGSGHTVLYLGDGTYTHCTPRSRPDSYDYENKKSREYESGGIFVDPITMLLDEHLFKLDTTKRIAIERPLDVVGEPTKKTMARLGEAKNLDCGVEVSHPGGQYAQKGDIITYTVFVKNRGDEDKAVSVEFAAPKCTKLVGECQKSLELSKGERKEVNFEVKLEEDEDIYIESPFVTANGLEIYAPKVLIGKKIKKELMDELCKNVADCINENVTAVEAASVEYKKIGISMDSKEKQHIFNCFYLHDSTSGDILTRRAQNPRKDSAVYSLFGGTGVSTPEMISYPDIRCNQIRKRDILPGDIIVCSANPYTTETYSCFYTGNSLIGRFDVGGDVSTIEGEEIDRFIDSLFGRFCFVVLRPSLLD